MIENLLYTGREMVCGRVRKMLRVVVTDVANNVTALAKTTFSCWHGRVANWIANKRNFAGDGRRTSITYSRAKTRPQFEQLDLYSFPEFLLLSGAWVAVEYGWNVSH
jgi:hypothetical protein